MHFDAEENRVFILQRLNIFAQMFLGAALLSCHAANFVGCLIFGFGSFSTGVFSSRKVLARIQTEHMESCVIILMVA